MVVGQSLRRLGTRLLAEAQRSDPQVSGRELFDAACCLSQASTSALTHGASRGYSSLMDAWAARGEAPSASARRGAWAPGSLGHGPIARWMTSLSKTGVPGPDPAVAAALSTHHGGHHVRRLQLARSVLELDDVLHSTRRVLQPIHMAVAARQLQKLSRATDAVLPFNGHLFQARRIIAQLEDLAAERAPRLTAWHIGCLLEGADAARHTLKPETLNLWAARVVADECQRLALASDGDVRCLVRGFAAQGYDNTVFWQRLAGHAHARLARGTLTPGQGTPTPGFLVALLQDVSRLQGPARDAFASAFEAAALAAAGRDVDALTPAQLVDLAQLLGNAGADGTLGKEEARRASHALAARGADLVRSGRLSPKQVALMVNGVRRLGLASGGGGAPGGGGALPAELADATAAWLASLPTTGGAAGRGAAFELQHATAIAAALAASGATDPAPFATLAAAAAARLEGGSSPASSVIRAYGGGGAQAQPHGALQSPPRWALSALVDAFGRAPAGAPGAAKLARAAAERLASMGPGGGGGGGQAALGH